LARLTVAADGETKGEKDMAKFKVGDKVRIIGGGVETIKSVHPKGRGTGFGPRKIDYYATREGGGFITDDDISGLANSRSCNSNNPVVAKAMNACGTAKNADDINLALGRATDRLNERIKEELKKQAESYAYWMEASCGREINNLIGVASKNEDVQPSIVAELKILRKRVDDAIAASKRLPR
jgi:hypothetical protein